MNRKAKELKSLLLHAAGDLDCLEVLERWSRRSGYDVASQDFKIEARYIREAAEKKEQKKEPVIPEPEVVIGKPLSAAAVERDTCFNCSQKLHGFIGYVDSAGEIYCEDCVPKKELKT